MYRRGLWQAVVCLLLAGLVWEPGAPAGAAFSSNASNASNASATPPPPPASPSLRAQVVPALKHDLSPALRDLPPASPRSLSAQPVTAAEIPLGRLPRAGRVAASAVDPVVQDRPAGNVMPGPLRSWEGVNNRNAVLPPDTQGDAGPNHYVQWVNLSFQIWDKQGHSLYGPAAGNTLWQGFGDLCETRNDGDPITLYDPLADRWVMTQFAVPSSGPYYECIAISQTPDPTGAWYRYAFLVSQTKMNDYPKLGVWPDAYYMTANQFTPGWGGAGVLAFDRARMLQGQPASFVYFDLYGVNANFGGMLPADLDGALPPPAGTPGIFAEVDTNASIPGPNGSDALRLWYFHVDWSNPANATFGLNGQPNLILPVQPFNFLCTNTADCIPQKGTTVRLDAIADRLMQRLQYRNFGDREALVVNHTVDAGGGQAGIRWYELRQTSGAPWSVFQQSTYAPDANHRWMGSAAMDRMGNIALGFSVSGSDLYPSIRYAGRLAADPPGQLAQGETELMAGGGAQTHTASRWGDYSTLTVDPVDDCTFWYTNEYLATTGWVTWQTRIGAFKFPDCQSDRGTLTGTVSDLLTAGPVAGTVVQASAASGVSQSTTTGAEGRYALLLVPGTYTVTASAYGYLPATQAGVSTTVGVTSTLDLVLTPRQIRPVSGIVSDAATGWPLYAGLQIEDYPGGTIWSDPVTGYYTVSLPVGSGYTFHVTPWVAGYQPVTRTIGTLVSPRVENFALSADTTTCRAPGYQLAGADCVAQAGGLVVGNTSDANTFSPLPGVTVADDRGNTTIAQPTTNPAEPGAFYALFSPAGSHTITATLTAGYGPISATVAITAGAAVRQDFRLPAGQLSLAPPSLSVTVTLGSITDTQIQLANRGDLAAGFSLNELPRLAPAGPIQRPAYALKPFRHTYRSAAGLALYPAPSAPSFPAGPVWTAWAAGSAAPYGIAFDAPDNTVWVASPSAGWGGANLLAEYRPDGSPTGRSHEFTWNPAYGPADLAYNANTGKLWAMNVAGSLGNCIHEIDPANGVTGRTICPGGPGGFPNSQRGLAYDPATDTWFAGSWNDFMIYRFDGAGRILTAVNVGLAASGLAYNPATRHLFVMTNNDPNQVYVLDEAHAYALLGRFAAGQGFAANGGAGLDLDPDGGLWAVDQNTATVYRLAAGEAPGQVVTGVPWLDESPVTGTVPPHGSRTVTLTLSATGPAITQPGVYHVQLAVGHDTPYIVPLLPITMTVVMGPPYHMYLPLMIQ